DRRKDQQECVDPQAAVFGERLKRILNTPGNGSGKTFVWALPKEGCETRPHRYHAGISSPAHRHSTRIALMFASNTSCSTMGEFRSRRMATTPLADSPGERSSGFVSAWPMGRASSFRPPSFLTVSGSSCRCSKTGNEIDELLTCNSYALGALT